MRHSDRFTSEYFQKFSTTPVQVIPFNPQTKKIAHEYMNLLDTKLSKWSIQSELIGSTALEIAGKGEIEIGLYLTDDNWNEVKSFLLSELKNIGSEDAEYARFNDEYKGVEIEIILTKGYTSKVNKKVLEYLKQNPEAIQEYLDIKNKYSYSKREYYIQKNEFFKNIIEALPED